MQVDQPVEIVPVCVRYRKKVGNSFQYFQVRSIRILRYIRNALVVLDLNLITHIETRRVDEINVVFFFHMMKNAHRTGACPIISLLTNSEKMGECTG